MMNNKFNILENLFEEKTGDNFKSFYKINKPKLVWHITKYTKDPIIAEDHVEDAFIQALINIETYKSPEEGGAKVITWIYKISENIVKKSFKDQEKLPCDSLDKDISEKFKLSNIIPYDDNTHDIDEYNVFVKKSKVIKDAIFELSDKESKYKTVLIMREIEGMAYKEISDQLNINLSTIKSQIKKGRLIIKRKVIKKLEEIDYHN